MYAHMVFLWYSWTSATKMLLRKYLEVQPGKDSTLVWFSSFSMFFYFLFSLLTIIVFCGWSEDLERVKGSWLKPKLRIKVRKLQSSDEAHIQLDLHSISYVALMHIWTPLILGFCIDFCPLDSTESNHCFYGMFC